jgi:hypothetical protein
MSRPKVADPSEEQARLYDQALRLTEAFCARLRIGNDTGAEAFTREREALLQRVGFPDPMVAPDGDDSLSHQESRRKSVAAIERMLELDRELVRLLEERKARLGLELRELVRGRRTLAAYRGSSALSPVFVDRMG